MSSKILTVSVAAYNIEKYIRQCLESLVVPEILDDLEVFVIDDGGTDGTLEIAKEYAAKYPASFFPIHKDNGGWGSTVNYSIAHATGKYFKILDGDDWFDQKSFVDFVNHLKVTDADVIVTNGFTGPDEESMVCINRKVYSEGETIELKNIMGEMDPLPTWRICYKTNILVNTHFTYPEHSYYTDMYYIMVPFSLVDTIMYLNLPVYCYRTDRPGNTMSISSRLEHQSELIEVCRGIISFCSSEEKKGNKNSLYLERRMGTTYAVIARTLLYNPVCQETKKLVSDLDKFFRSRTARASIEVEKIGKIGKFLWLMRRTNYHAYWLTKLLLKNK